MGSVVLLLEDVGLSGGLLAGLDNEAIIEADLLGAGRPGVERGRRRGVARADWEREPP
jgi:hypothetical protein